jgi:hypothetical protein
VGDVEDLQDAEDERQPQRHDEQPRGVDDPVDEDRGCGIYFIFLLKKFLKKLNCTGRPGTRP